MLDSRQYTFILLPSWDGVCCPSLWIQLESVDTSAKKLWYKWYCNSLRGQSLGTGSIHFPCFWTLFHGILSPHVKSPLQRPRDDLEMEKAPTEPILSVSSLTCPQVSDMQTNAAGLTSNRQNAAASRTLPNTPSQLQMEQKNHPV